MEKWYVAHSKPRSEELLWKQFRLRNLEAYYPCIKVQTVNLRARQVQPYFPSYLFVRVDLNLIGRSTLDWMPGGAGLVSFGDEPAFVTDDLVYAIKRQIDNLNMISSASRASLCKGDNVVIHDGAFAGYEGVFDTHLSGTDRVRVLLSLLDNRLLPVEMSVNSVYCLD